MCRSVRCRICSKTTWSGCGHHVNQILAGVPRADRCPGHPKPEKTGTNLLSKLFGRR